MRIAGLWRYPVKGLLGETAEAATFDGRGMTGDRNWAVVGLDGKLGSGKTTRRFRRMPNLFTMSARTHDREVLVTVNGWEGSVTDPTTAARVSEVIGERVTLEPERVVPHHDEGGVHVVTTTSLRLIDGVDVRRLRPNVLIECSGEGPIEDSWIGMHLRMGAVDLRVVQRMPRCVARPVRAPVRTRDPLDDRESERRVSWRRRRGLAPRQGRHSPTRQGIGLFLIAGPT